MSLSSNFIDFQGNNPGIKSGTLAARPVTDLIGMLYIATDTATWYRWTGLVWQSIGGGGSFVPTTRTLTIGGLTQDLSADRTWSNLVVNGGQAANVVINSTGAFSTQLNSATSVGITSGSSTTITSGTVTNIGSTSATNISSSGTTNISGAAGNNAILQIAPSSTRSILATVNPIGSSGMSNLLQVVSTVNQSGSAGYSALFVSVTESATGSGAKNLIDARVGGANRFRVDNAGSATLAGDITTASGGGSGSINWRLGALTTGAVVVDTTRYINVTIGGVAYKLIIAT